MQGREAVEHEVEARLAEALPEVDLLEVAVLGRGQTRTLRAVIDHPRGVDHDLCAEVTRVLDRAGMRERFAVEVWSPGPERPLRTTRHFAGAVGTRVRLRLDPGAGDLPRQVTGTLVAAGEDTLTVASGEGVMEVPRDRVRRANVVAGSVGRSEEDR
jgi:ribosome maturation factor RimP